MGNKALSPRNCNSLSSSCLHWFDYFYLLKGFDFTTLKRPSFMLVHTVNYTTLLTSLHFKTTHNGANRSNNPLDLPFIPRSPPNNHNPQSIHRTLPTLPAVLPTNQSSLQRLTASTSSFDRRGNAEYRSRGQEG